MRKNEVLVLFTACYPFGNVEIFMETEIKFLSLYFEKIIIIPFTYYGNKRKRQTPINVEVLTPLTNGSQFQLLIEQIFNIQSISFFFKEIVDKQLYIKPSKLYKAFRIAIRTRMVFKRLKHMCIFDEIQNKCIVYFYWGSYQNTISILLKNELKNIPIISRYHGSDLYEELSSNEGYIPYQQQVLLTIDKAFMISEYGFKYFNEKYKNNKNKIEISRLGVIDFGLSLYNPNDFFKIISCSHLIDLKRVLWIAESLKLIHFKLEWTHIGNGIEGQKLDELCENILKTNENIKINRILKLNNDELRQLYVNEHFDVFINVSISEGVPVTIMESLCSGIPVIATNVGGTSELVNESNGYLLPKDTSPKEIAQTIIQFNQLSYELKTQMRLNARETWNKLCDSNKNYTEFIKNLLNL